MKGGYRRSRKRKGERKRWQRRARRSDKRGRSREKVAKTDETGEKCGEKGKKPSEVRDKQTNTCGKDRKNSPPKDNGNNNKSGIKDILTNKK